MLGKKIYVLLLVVLATNVQASFDEEFKKFFEDYEARGKDFDVGITDLYSDDANVSAVRKMSDGIEQTMKVSGSEWKKMLVDAMDIAKKRDDKSEFSDVNVQVTGDTAKITAKRYSTSKCFFDERYYMVAKRFADGDIRIIEEFMESPLKSNCDTVPDDDLSLVLEATAKTLNRRTPLMVDSDTKLMRASSEGNVFTYHYELVNYASYELDSEALRQNIELLLIEQSCTAPNLTPIVNKGGTLSYRYSGNDGEELFTVEVTQQDCS